MGAAFGSGRRRCMAISVAVPVGELPRQVDLCAGAKIRGLKSDGHDLEAEMGRSSRSSIWTRSAATSTQVSRRAQNCWSTVVLQDGRAIRTATSSRLAV